MRLEIDEALSMQRMIMNIRKRVLAQDTITNMTEALLQLIQSRREIGLHNLTPKGKAFLHQIHNFLREHQAAPKATKHYVDHKNYCDWWSDMKVSETEICGMRITNESDRARLYNCIRFCFEHNIPLTLKEVREEYFRLAQDIQIYADQDTKMTIQEILNPDGPFLYLMAMVMGTAVLPVRKHPDWDIVVFDASGMCLRTNRWKTSFRLVWPEITVDKHNAMNIRELLLREFRAAETSVDDFQELKDQLRKVNPRIRWEKVFDTKIYHTKYGIRMPFCDKVSDQKLERRPYVPYAVFRFSYRQGQRGLEWKLDMSIPQQNPNEYLNWLELGVLRPVTPTLHTLVMPPKNRTAKVDSDGPDPGPKELSRDKLQTVRKQVYPGKNQNHDDVEDLAREERQTKPVKTLPWT